MSRHFLKATGREVTVELQIFTVLKTFLLVNQFNG